MSMITSDTLRGDEPITFTTVALASLNGKSIELALIPIMVRIQEAKEVANKSVGEKVSPLPWLSTGATVSMDTPDLV